jgi:serine protease AprX
MSYTRHSLHRACRAAVVGAVLLVLGAPAYAQNGKTDEYVQQAIREGRNDFPVIIRYKNLKALDRGKQRLGKLKAALKREIRQQRSLGAKLNRTQLFEVLNDAELDHLSYDAPVSATQLLSGVLSPVGVSVDASGAREARERYGVTGAGVTVAVIDSGVQPGADLPATRVRAFVDFVNGYTFAYDDYGHGTHVAGIIGGNGTRSSGGYTGVAPGANIVALKVLDSRGAGTTSDVIAALDWVRANHAAYNIRVVNLSIGHPVFEKAVYDPLVLAVEELTRRGIIVAVASGNLGTNKSTGQVVYQSVTSPGNAPSALTVGATNTKGTLVRSDDVVADFSGRGPTRLDKMLKPDVVAPGYAITSSVPNYAYLALAFPTLKLSGGYMRLNGTSMATPIVAGAAALMVQANPRLSANTVKAIVQYTAQRLPGFDLVSQGAGELNVTGAVRLAKMINPAAPLGTQWVNSEVAPTRADLLFNEPVLWGRATIWQDALHTGMSPYMHLAQWDDNIVWGYMFDNIVWGMDENIVWGQFSDNIVWGYMLDNIVWGMTDDNIVWGMTDDNIVWGYMLDDNIVWGWDDNIVWGMDDNIVWGMLDDNIVWGWDDNIVWGMMDDNIVWGMSDMVGTDLTPLAVTNEDIYNAYLQTYYYSTYNYEGVR